MDIKVFDLSETNSQETKRLFTIFLALQYLKGRVKSKGQLLNVLKEQTDDYNIIREMCSTFIGAPWQLHELDDNEHLILKEMHEFISI
jgi:hypothetical protein